MAPLDVNDGPAASAAVLVVTSAEPEDFFAEYEVIEDGKGYREWLVPASLINTRCAVTLAPL